jgi:GNAT superfamily N-acetyltransferase
VGKAIEFVRDVSQESLARANETHLREGFALCVDIWGGEVSNAPDLRWAASRVPSDELNRVTFAQLAPETLDTRIDWVIERAQALGVPFQWNIGPSTHPTDLGAHLLRHGLSDAGEEPAMGVALAGLPGKLPVLEGVTIERVHDRAGAAQWARTVSLGFGAPTPEDAEPLVACVTRGAFDDAFDDDAVASYYLARLDGEPVASAGLALAAGIAGVFAVATFPLARRRGLGAAVTLAALLDARARGYAVGVLQASEMGYPVYKRLGFTEQFRYHNYVWRPE